LDKAGLSNVVKAIEETNKKNIMNSDEPRPDDVPIQKTHNSADIQIRKSQYEKIKRTVEQQSPSRVE
jgi:hypothetical protein